MPGHSCIFSLQCHLVSYGHFKENQTIEQQALLSQVHSIISSTYVKNVEIHSGDKHETEIKCLKLKFVSWQSD